MKITTVVSKNQLVQLATGCIYSDLYHKEGTLFDELIKIISGKMRKKVIMLVANNNNYNVFSYKCNDLVGVCLYYPNLKEIHIFTKPEARRQGIATKLLNTLRNDFNLHTTVFKSHGAIDEAGQKFFENNCIHTYNLLLNVDLTKRVLSGEVMNVLTEINKPYIKDLHIKLKKQRTNKKYIKENNLDFNVNKSNTNATADLAY